jgi:hypothetical protein
LNVTPKTIENWEHPNADRNCRIPATAFNVMRRLARDAGADSLGRIKVTA